MNPELQVGTMARRFIMNYQDILIKMTREEKAALLGGASEWTTREFKHLGIPALLFADGPHGIRKQEGKGDHLGLNGSVPATCFPTAATVVNSWDQSLGEAVGQALGEEAKAQGVDVLLGPGLNIKRSPLCGRNFEYFSEDPYLAGKMAAAYVRGIQSKNVVSCIKHFAVNSQELRRMAMNAVLDERTLRELYLTGFEIAVKEGNAGAVMTSYNEVNGEYANENPHLLLDILRGEWCFEGLVVTDWGGSNDHVQAVKCRSNVEMPNPGLATARELLKAIEEGRLTEQELDICVGDVLKLIIKLKKEVQEKAEVREGFDKEAHHALAAKAARESIVLLKNGSGEEKILPLQKKTKTVLIGDFADAPRYQGAGSSVVNPTKLECMRDVIGKFDLEYVGYAQGYCRAGAPDTVLEQEALKLAEQAEVVLYCFGLDESSESEGMDRVHMKIPQNQIALLEKISKVNKNIVGILNAGSAVEMPWCGYLEALLYGGLCGQAGAEAMLDIITGGYNPSGKLAETYPVCYEDTPAYDYYPSRQRSSQYREGLYVGYRYYDTVSKAVQYPFGHGLSYTEFSYSDLKIERDGVKFSIENIGTRDGAEIAQLYVGGPRGHIYRPEKELKGFEKIFLAVGEKKEVTILFDDKTFRYWNTCTDRFETEEGEYRIMVGASVADIRLSGILYRKGTTERYPEYKKMLSSYETGDVRVVSDEEYEILLGKPIPKEEWSGILGKNDAICQLYYAKSGLARLVYYVLTAMIKRNEKKGKADLNVLFIYNMPFRAIAKMTHGAVDLTVVDGVIQIVNGHFLGGLKQAVTGVLKNRSENRKYEKALMERAEMHRTEH